MLKKLEVLLLSILAAVILIAAIFIFPIILFGLIIFVFYKVCYWYKYGYDEPEHKTTR